MFDGTAWSQQQAQTAQVMYAIGGADASHVFVGGANGFLYVGVPQ
jgi:hypothetical protein